jgi:hypothetical protein
MADKMKVTLRLKAKDADGSPFFDGPLKYWLTREQFTELEGRLMDMLKQLGLEGLERAKQKDVADSGAQKEDKFVR